MKGIVSMNTIAVGVIVSSTEKEEKILSLEDKTAEYQKSRQILGADVTTAVADVHICDTNHIKKPKNDSVSFDPRTTFRSRNVRKLNIDKQKLLSESLSVETID